MPRMSRVLVVGGAGYVGGWLVDEAIAAGHEVRVYDLLLYEDRYLKDVPFVAGDVLDRTRLQPHLGWADTVVWLAALVGDPASALDPVLTRKINFESVEWLSSTFDGRIVFPSTCSVYGAQQQELDEDSALEPLSLYAETKVACEQVLTEHSDSLILRLATLAGVGDTYSRIRLDLVVNLLVARAKVIGELQVFGGRQYRPLLHVRDVATAVVPHLAPGGPAGIFNLGAENVTILELAERIVGRVGHATIQQLETPFQDTRNYRTTFDRARDQLGFEPSWSMDHAIDQVARLIDAGRVKDLSLAQFSNMDALRPYLRPEAIPLGREVRTSHSLARHASPYQATAN
jgi:nucleoside-diphosphate-sugar epimerase